MLLFGNCFVKTGQFALRYQTQDCLTYMYTSLPNPPQGEKGKFSVIAKIVQPSTQEQKN